MRILVAACSFCLLAGCASNNAGSVGPAQPAIVESVHYPAGQERGEGVLFRPSGSGPFPGLVVVHEDYGLADWVKEQALRLAEKGYVTLAVDLYRGQVVHDVLEAHILDRGLPEDRVLSDLKGAVEYLSRRPDVRGNALGIIGWDSGGGYALDVALQEPRLRAVVVCYGRLTTDPALLASLKAPVLGIFAGKDEGITPETLTQFRTAMQKANRRLAGIEVYPNRGHGFMNPAHASKASAEDTAATADAWTKIDRFFAAELKQ